MGIESLFKNGGKKNEQKIDDNIDSNKDEENKLSPLFSSIFEEMNEAISEERIKNLKMFRVATFILQKYGNKEEIKKALENKNKEDRRSALMNIMLESWHEVALHKKQDLDCTGVLFLLDAAGFKINDVEEVEKGEIKDDMVTFDSGNINGMSYERYIDEEDEEMPIKYTYAIGGDHHGEKLDENTSSSKYLYEFLTKLDFVRDMTGYLKAIVDFITREDNKNYKYTEEEYRNSANNLFGYKGFIKENNLMRLLKNLSIKDKYLEISDIKDDAKIESIPLTYKDLEDLDLLKYRDQRISAIKSSINSINRVEELDKKSKLDNKDGYIYKIGDYNIIVNESYVIKFPIDVSIAKGYNTVISYSEHDNKFSVSFIGVNMPKFSDEFLKMMKEYGIISIRGAMLIKDEKNFKAKPIDKDFIYGPNGLINELENDK